MPTYRISKYHFDVPSASGLNEDWTSVSDIGRIFNGVRLTTRRYLEVERSYLSLIFTTFILGGERHFRIENLEGEASDLKDAYSLVERLGLDEISKFSYEQLSKSSLPISFLLDVVRLILREHIWAQVIGEKGMVLDVGYDYYCYLSGKNVNPKICELASCLGLVVKPLKRSPYKRS